MPLDPRQLRCLPTGIDPRIFCEDISSPPGSALPGFPFMKPEKTYEAEHKPLWLHPQFQALSAANDQHFQEKKSTCINGLLGIAAIPREAFGSSQKRLLIFDQTRNQTRLIQCCPFSPQRQSTTVAKPVQFPDLCDVENVFKTDNFIPKKDILHEGIDENRVHGEETEMHEDTEEINALLYSDEEEDYSDSDDEVMSTDHSPFPVKGTCNKEDLEDVDSAEGPHKRQKLLDGGYNKSLLVETASLAKLEGSDRYGNITESSYASEEEMASGLSNKQLRKDNIRIALRILECIVPSAKGKEALLVLDEAIDYLKLLKQNAKSFGVNYC